jgi:hypothetical protein
MLKSKFSLIVLMSFFLFSCQSEYERTVSKEMKSGKIYEDLIFDMKLGQTQKEFYARCWDLNKEKKISQGSGNRYAKYLIPEGEIFEEPDPIEMLFYGIFDEEKIMRGMDMIFKYSKWSPWNEDYHSDRLIERLNKHYMHLYEGNPFIKFDTGLDKLPAYVKVDGNRRILMYPLNNHDVSVKIEDLRFKLLESKE